MIDLWGYDIGKFVWFCAAGRTFFPGISLLIVSAILPSYRQKLWGKIIRDTFIVLGVLLVFLSATPLNIWIYITWLITFFAFFLITILRPRSVIILKLPRIVFLCSFIAAFILEIPFHHKTKISQNNFKTFYVIGDSVSAGIGGKNERTWPKVLKDEHGIDVIDLSIGGATVTSALKQASQLELSDAVVFIEIGGNDLFNHTPYNLFEKNLAEILKKAIDSGRKAVMLELPLRPFDIEYGMIQRKLAKRYNVILVPKEFMASVFMEKSATVDLVHLSAKGHQLMADKVWALLKDSFTNKDTTGNK
jgi:acyl-CoA thioesterase-1